LYLLAEIFNIEKNRETKKRRTRTNSWEVFDGEVFFLICMSSTCQLNVIFSKMNIDDRFGQAVDSDGIDS